MVLPGKNVVYKDSVIYKFPVILKILSDEGFCRIADLEKRTSCNFLSVAEFVQTMDCLFALGKIVLNENEDGVYLC